MFDDIVMLMGEEFSQYPVFTCVICTIVFCVLVNTAFSLIRDILEHVAGYR